MTFKRRKLDAKLVQSKIMSRRQDRHLHGMFTTALIGCGEKVKHHTIQPYLTCAMEVSRVADTFWLVGKPTNVFMEDMKKHGY